MKIRFAFLVLFVVVAAGMRLAAHHSFAAQYDPTKAIRITGTLSKVEWGNPHTYFYLDVKEPDGTVVTWGCEGAAPAQLSRRGFKRGDLKLGDTMTVDGELWELSMTHVMPASMHPSAVTRLPTYISCGR